MLNAWTRLPAASSIASGIPSSRRQICATFSTLSAANPKSDPGAPCPLAEELHRVSGPQTLQVARLVRKTQRRNSPSRLARHTDRFTARRQHHQPLASVPVALRPSPPPVPADAREIIERRQHRTITDAVRHDPHDVPTELTFAERGRHHRGQLGRRPRRPEPRPTTRRPHSGQPLDRRARAPSEVLPHSTHAIQRQPRSSMHPRASSASSATRPHEARQLRRQIASVRVPLQHQSRELQTKPRMRHLEQHLGTIHTPQPNYTKTPQRTTIRQRVTQQLLRRVRRPSASTTRFNAVP